jgi:glutamine amidotransferase
LLATRGLEHGVTKGLDWIAGEVRKIEVTDPRIKVPHMGWNDVALTPHVKSGHERHSSLLEEGEAYFLHSYHFAPDEGHDIAAMTDHGGGLVAAVARPLAAGQAAPSDLAPWAILRRGQRCLCSSARGSRRTRSSRGSPPFD